mmetsp:Transcript_31411/g.46318  ORF Transcript_31411/g.46318 Transcript_31411/m.46318 type:complete len:634 (-) Transcript_31411:315-2216(-)
MSSHLHWRKRIKKTPSNFYPPLGNLGISQRRKKGNMLRLGKEQDDASEAGKSGIDYQSVSTHAEDDDVTQREEGTRKKYTRFWSRVRKGDQDVIKTLALFALLFLVLVRLTSPSANASPTLVGLSSTLRSSNIVKMQDDEDMYDPTIKMTNGNVAQSGSSNSLLQQQQLALLQAQQQQQVLWQAQAQKQAEENLRAQALALQQQQQQQQHQALLMQQQAMLQQQSNQMTLMQNMGTFSSQSQFPGGNVAAGLVQAAVPQDTSTSAGIPAVQDAAPVEDASTIAATPDESASVATSSTETGGEGADLAELANFENTWEPYNEKSIPIYWHIPKAGGSTVKDTIGACHRLVMATEFGVTDGHDQDTEIAVVYPKPPGGVTDDRSPFVNVDTTTPAGIERAAKMGFADANLAGCVVTPFLYESNALFTPTGKGRLFAVFRHPIDRAVSMFYYIQVATWEPSYKPELQEWSLKQYAESDVVENNWMVRQLSNQLSGDLDDSHLKKALEVVRSKFMVGLMKQVERSMARFERYYRWTYHVNPTNQEICRERMMSGGSNSNSKNKKEKPKPGDEVWDLFAAQNVYDLQLYEYVETLFEEQESFVEGIPDDFRKIDGTCCKCDPPTFPPEGFACPKKVDA